MRRPMLRIARALALGLAVFPLLVLSLARHADAQETPKVEVVPQIGHSSDFSYTFSPDGTLALSGSIDRTIKLWDAATGRLLRTFEGHARAVHSVALSPDGTRVLSGGDDNTLKL